MSGLEKFQGTSDWIQRFKSLLSAARAPTTPTKDFDSSAESSICLELNEELQSILQKKKINRNIMTTSFKADNKENLNPISISVKETNLNVSQIKSGSVYDDSIINPSFIEGTSSNSFEITNLSFSALEQACNKSISDPDSTIYKYVEQIKKTNDSKNFQIIDDEDPDISDENKAIDRLIKDLEAEELKYSNIGKKTFSVFSNDDTKLRQTFSLNDQTQLADIEEPSALWETTVADNDTEKYQISPTKMVGLLRPSTILEESTTTSNTSNTTTENSFNTAQKLDSDNTNIQSDLTSQYETACESARSNNNTTNCDIEISKTHQLPSFLQKYNFFDSNIIATDSFDLSNIKDSCAITSNPNESAQNYSDSLIEPQLENVIHIHKKNIKQEKSFQESNFDESPITIEVSDDSDMSDENEDNDTDEKVYKKSKENLNDGFSLQNIEDIVLNETSKDLTLKEFKDLDVSHEFNDTLEEVEYIMKHGMEMLKNSATKSKLIENVQMNPKETIVTPSKSPRIKTPIQNISPPKSHALNDIYKNKFGKISSSEKHNNTEKSPSCTGKLFLPKTNVNIAVSPCKNSPSLSNKTMIKSTSIKKNPHLSSKDLFRKPVSVNNMSKIPQPKSLSNIKKSIYSDVISPVGAYIKKTPVCPTETKIKETTIKSLDYGQATGKATVQYHPPKRFEIKKGNTPSLPQKFYKSAEYRCVVDERTPLNIPGGESIHKYLKPALAPSIVRHDGKMKIGSPIQYAEKHNVDVNKTVDSTMTDLADLSTISGDVSIYTLKDAQKFSYVKEKNNFGYKK